MKDLFQCGDPREEFQRWLGCGIGPLTITQRGQAAVILNSLPKTEEIDYLYSTAAESGGVTWNNDLKFFGIYDHRDGSLYMTLDSLRSGAVKDMVAPVEADAMTMDEIISAEVNRRVEDIIANDRGSLSAAQLTDWQLLRSLGKYQEQGARNDAIHKYIKGQEPDGKFHSRYKLKGLQESTFIAYLTARDDFVQGEAETYIAAHQEDILLDIQKKDLLLSEYQALIQDPDDPAHQMKAISDAVESCGGKAVKAPSVQTEEMGPMMQMGGM